MSYDEGLLERCVDAAHSLGIKALQKNVFGSRGLMRGKTMFCAVGEDSIIIKLTSLEYTAALEQPGVVPFTPYGAKKLGRWIEITADAVADEPDLRDWIAAGLRGIE